MKKKLFLFIILASSLVVLSSIFKNNNSYANKSDLPSWQVTFYQEYGNGTVSGGQIYISKNGINLFDSPKPTNSSGIAWFDNGGSAFPDGTYEVRGKRDGFGDGVTTVVISGGAPTSPITTVRSGPAL